MKPRSQGARFKRVIPIGCVTLLLAASLSGRSLGTDVETLLRPPRMTGEQQQVQLALEEYIFSVNGDVKGSPVEYVLKYPKSGEFRSAFIIKDLNGDGVSEALAFYRTNSETGNVRINLLYNQGGRWQSVNDMEGASGDIERVRFSDLNGDGTLEFLCGWNIDNIRDKKLVLYSLTENNLTEWYSGIYSDIILTDMTDCGHDNMLLLYADTAKNTTLARLWTVQGNETTDQNMLVEIGSASLDGFISQFASSHVTKISDELTGIAIDAYRTSGGMLTEIIYWDGSKLQAPFYDEKTNASMVAFRDADIASRDIDGDGTIEWPLLLPAFETAATSQLTLNKGDKVTHAQSNTSTEINHAVRYVEWCSWNTTKESVLQEFSCIFNESDNYYLRTGNEWKGKFTYSYTPEEATLRLYALNEGKMGEEILTLRTVKGLDEKSGASADVGKTFQILEESSTVRYEVWFSETSALNLNLERIHYMFIRLSNK